MLWTQFAKYFFKYLPQVAPVRELLIQKYNFQVQWTAISPWIPQFQHTTYRNPSTRISLNPGSLLNACSICRSVNENIFRYICNISFFIPITTYFSNYITSDYGSTDMLPCCKIMCHGSSLILTNLMLAPEITQFLFGFPVFDLLQ